MDWKVLFAAPAAVLLMAAASSGFENAKGWGSSSTGPGPTAYRIGLDPQSAYLDAPTLSVQSTVALDEFTHGSATTWATGYAGKRVRLSGFYRTEGVKHWAGVYMEARERPDSASFVGPRRVLKSSELPLVVGTTGDPAQPRDSAGWQPFAITLDVPQGNGGAVMMGPLVRGEGKVWVARMRFEEVSRSVPLSVDRLPLRLDAFNAGLQQVPQYSARPQPPGNLDLM
ncbi:hypothetical protein [Roseateles flavus]|uniref:Uncharacterized protein n=1 Tax=Roseateles flavus TaxID=3149041 RepID=A0ABV0GF29_9BURK